MGGYARHALSDVVRVLALVFLFLANTIAYKYVIVAPFLSGSEFSKMLVNILLSRPQTYL